jgi:hypothetical protein
VSSLEMLVKIPRGTNVIIETLSADFALAADAIFHSRKNEKLFDQAHGYK